MSEEEEGVREGEEGEGRGGECDTDSLNIRKE